MGTVVRRWPTGLPIGRLSKPLLLASVPVVTWLFSAGEGERLLPAVALVVGMVAFLLDSLAALIWPRPARKPSSLDAGVGRLIARGRRDNAWWYLSAGVLGAPSALVLLLAADLPWVIAAVLLALSGLLAWIGAFVLVRGDKYVLFADHEGLRFRPAYGRPVVIQWTDRSAVIDERAPSMSEIPFLTLKDVRNARGEVANVNLNLELLDVTPSELERRLTALLWARGNLSDGAAR